jgi:hypothetical protein
MEKGKRLIIKLLIVLISVYFIDGGRSFLIVTNNIQILLARNHSNDLEAPHQHHIVNFNTDEKWVVPHRFDFPWFKNNSVKFLFSQNIPSQEFLNSIWQPPKFLSYLLVF